MRVATHNGTFHADEVFAIAALGLLDEPIEVVRTRDREEIAAADLRVDVGFTFDPAARTFDHHQREFSEERENGVQYASFGLIWREYGSVLCAGEDEVAAIVDQVLVQPVDANDTGQAITRSVIEGVRPVTVSGVVAGFNPRWDEKLSDGDERGRFDAAVEFARGVLQREIASAGSGHRAVQLVREAIATAGAGARVIELSENVPWKQIVVAEAPDALFVIYPKRQGFGLECVPRELGTFDNRVDLPEAWGGLDATDLSALTGVADALFCHAGRFLCVARSRAGIGELARQALAPHV